MKATRVDNRVYRHTFTLRSGHVVETLMIHEAYYKNRGDSEPNGYTKEPVCVSADDLAGLLNELDKLREALDKPILEYEDT